MGLARADASSNAYRYIFKYRSLSFTWKRTAFKALMWSALTAAGEMRAWSAHDLAMLDKKRIVLSRAMLGTKVYTANDSEVHSVAHST